MNLIIVVLLALPISLQSYAGLWCADTLQDLTPTEAASRMILPYSEIQIEVDDQVEITFNVQDNYNEQHSALKGYLINEDSVSLDNRVKMGGIILGRYRITSSAGASDEAEIKLENGRILVLLSYESQWNYYTCEISGDYRLYYDIP